MSLVSLNRATQSSYLDGGRGEKVGAMEEFLVVEEVFLVVVEFFLMEAIVDIVEVEMVEVREEIGGGWLHFTSSYLNKWVWMLVLYVTTELVTYRITL